MKRKLTLSAHYNSKEDELVTLGLKNVQGEQEFHRKYELGQDLGYGSFATVQVARCRNTNELFACKMIEKNTANVNRIRDEVEILMSVEHRNIVGLHGAYETKTHVLLVLDHASGGELYRRFVNKKKYTEQEAKRVIFYLLKACTYLHSRNVVHRDIKLENILLDSQSSDSNILVCDFGQAKVLESGPLTFEESKRQRAYSKCGSDYYLPPEVLTGDAAHDAVDMWSIGVCMYILLSGNAPFDNEEGKLYDKIKKGQYDLQGTDWSDISTHAKNLISKLLTVNPQQRIKGEEALEHVWFADM